MCARQSQDSTASETSELASSHSVDGHLRLWGVESTCSELSVEEAEDPRIQTPDSEDPITDAPPPGRRAADQGWTTLNPLIFRLGLEEHAPIIKGILSFFTGTILLVYMGVSSYKFLSRGFNPETDGQGVLSNVTITKLIARLKGLSS